MIKLTKKELNLIKVVDKIQKLDNDYVEGFIHVYKNKHGLLDAEWQYDSGSMDREVEDENYSETRDRIVNTIQLSSELLGDDAIEEIYREIKEE